MHVPSTIGGMLACMLACINSHLHDMQCAIEAALIPGLEQLKHNYISVLAADHADARWLMALIKQAVFWHMRLHMPRLFQQAGNILCDACGRPQRRAVAGRADRAGGRFSPHIQPVPHSAAGAACGVTHAPAGIVACSSLCSWLASALHQCPWCQANSLA